MADGRNFESQQLIARLSEPPTKPLADPPQTSSDTATIEQKLDHWKRKLADAPAILELATDFPRPAVLSGRFARIEWAFGEQLSAGILKLAASTSTSFDSIILTAFSALLSRYSEQTDLLIGFKNENTAQHDAPPALAILRCQFADDVRFLDALRATQLAALEAGDNRGIAPERIAHALGLELSASRAPLIQAICIFGIVDKGHTPENGTGHPFDLVLRVTDPARLSGEIVYNTDLYRAGTIERMAGHLQALLNSALAAPEKPVASLPLLTNDEYQQIVFEWNKAAADFPEVCAHEMFEQQVQKTPNARAVVFGEESLTYAQLNQKANRLAHYLIKRGVRPDVLVGVCLKRSLDMAIALLGTLKAGGAYVPLDPAYPAERLAYMVQDANPALILTQEPLLGLLGKHSTDIFCMDRDESLLAQEDLDDPEGRARADTLAYVIYTSGSTGKPKGVALEHRGLSNLCVTQADAFEVDESSQVLQFASISFDAAVSETFVTLTRGACLHIIRQEALRSAYEITSLMEKSQISVVTLPPSLLAVLPKKPLPALKTLVLAGEAWPAELARSWAAGRRMLNAYGPTEGTVCATWFRAASSLVHTVPIGKPLANVKVYILDAHLSPVPVGVPGEIYIGGPGLARGYLNRPDLTAERFISNPFCADYSSRMYRTGDKGKYLEDGNIEFLGRIDNQVKLRGYRIELGEIEAALLTHEDIANAIVIIREDHPGERRLVAYVISRAAVNAQTLRSHLKMTLPDYMLPQNFVFLDELPMSPNGKVDRRALPAPSASNL